MYIVSVQLAVRPPAEVCFTNQHNVNIMTFYKEFKLKGFVGKSVSVPHINVEADLTHVCATLTKRNSANA